MSWKIDKDELLEAAEVIELVPSRPGVPSSEFFKVESTKNGIRLSVASEVVGDITLDGEGDWPFEKTFYLDRRVFIPFILVAKDLKSNAPFKFTGKKRLLMVRQGGRRASFISQEEVSGYGLPPKAELVSKLQLSDELRGLIHCARECATDDKTTPQLNCVYVKPNGNKVSVFATNRKIVYKAVAKNKMKSSRPIPFPLFLVKLLGSNKLKEIHWKKKYAALIFKHGKIWQPVSNKARTGFPIDDINKHMKRSQRAPVLLTLPSKVFSRILTRLCLYLTSVRRQDWTLELTATKGDKELVFVSDCGPASFRERVMLDIAPKKDIKLTWPLDMVEPIFQYMDQQKKGATLEIRLDEHGRSHIRVGHIALVIPRKD